MDNEGSPRGVSWDHTFFLLYTIHLKSACACDLFLYADAAAVITSHKDKTSAVNILRGGAVLLLLHLVVYQTICLAIF